MSNAEHYRAVTIMANRFGTSMKSMEKHFREAARRIKRVTQSWPNPGRDVVASQRRRRHR